MSDEQDRGDIGKENLTEMIFMELGSMLRAAKLSFHAILQNDSIIPCGFDLGSHFTLNK